MDLPTKLFTYSSPSQHQNSRSKHQISILKVSSIQQPKHLYKLANRFLSSNNTTNDAVSCIIAREERNPGSKRDKQSEESQRLSNYWHKIHGQDDWEGMLDPMDHMLRSELIRYGEMAQACYDAFDYDPWSTNYGSCRYPLENFFDRLGMSSIGYNVSRYIFATSHINLPNFFRKSRWPQTRRQDANWIGYVSVSNDKTAARLGRRDIVIAWRGTVTQLEWIHDLTDYLRLVSTDQIPCVDPLVKVESGFLDLYTDKHTNLNTLGKRSARDYVLSEIGRLVRRYSNEELSITITGHSLGSALAILNAYDIAETGINTMEDGRVVPISVFSFSGPRVGNLRFKKRLEELGVKVLRVVNVHDTVPKVPGIFFNEELPPIVQKIVEWTPWSYSHVGVKLALDHKISPFLKDTGDVSCFHNLEAHLHMLDGYHGKDKKFVPASERDPALVNKSCDFLKDDYRVPPYWSQDENKGMVRNPEGRWVLPERPDHEGHPDDMHQIHLNLISDDN